MTQSNGVAKMVGRAGSLMAVAGVLSFFFGIFGPTRTFMFAGLALIALSLVAFFVEELEQRRN
jgi:hypothetical protein